MPDKPSNLARFWNELKRRKVVRVVIVYATVAFVIIELINNVAEPLRLPDWTPTLVIMILAICFPIAIIFSWIFDFTSKGIKKTEAVELAKEQKEDYPQTDKISRFENSIAVLPFQDMSPQKDQEYFCDGMTEEIINALANLNNLKVIARTSTFAFKGKQKDIRDIGKKLNVETLLEGSIQKEGNRFRITTQLIKVADGSHLWSERYDRDMKDLFVIQDEISLAIVDKLKVKLLAEEKAAIVKHHTENLEAYNLCLKGNYYWQMMTIEGFDKATEYYEQSLQKDPHYALAYTGLAAIYMTRSTWGIVPPHEAYPKAKEYTNKALELDDTLAETLNTLCCISMYYDWNWKAAEQELKQALQLNPNSAGGHLFYSIFLGFTDRHDEAIAEAKRALELDPLSTYINTFLGLAYLYAHQYDKAIKEQRITIGINPNFFLAHFHLGQAYQEKLMIEEAIEEFEKAVNLSGGASMAVSSLASAYYEIGKKEKAEKLYNSLEQRSEKEYVPSTCFVFYHIIRGDHDQAFKWLEKAINERDGFLPWFIAWPIDKYHIRDEPRFNELIKKVGLE